MLFVLALALAESVVDAVTGYDRSLNTAFARLAHDFVQMVAGAVFATWLAS